MIEVLDSKENIVEGDEGGEEEKEEEERVAGDLVIDTGEEEAERKGPGVQVARTHPVIANIHYRVVFSCVTPTLHPPAGLECRAYGDLPLHPDVRPGGPGHAGPVARPAGAGGAGVQPAEQEQERGVGGGRGGGWGAPGE